MHSGNLWISDGRLIQVEDDVVRRRGLARFLRDERLVLINIGPAGTAVKWDLANSSWSSLYAVIGHLKSCPPPFHLSFFIDAWMTETCASAKAAAIRIDELIGRSDTRLLKEAYTVEKEVDKRDMPQLLQLALDESHSLPEFRIDHVFSPAEENFYIERVGSNTPLSKVMGQAWTDRAKGTWAIDQGFDQQVVPPYLKVFNSNRPYFGNVFAAIKPEGQEPTWFHYQRLIVPHNYEDGRQGITVFVTVGGNEAKPI